MSAFGNYLAEQLEERQRPHPAYTAGAFARDLGISPSMLSRFLASEETPSCNPATLTKICQGISSDPLVQAELQAAYLRDQIVAPGGKLITIAVQGSKTKRTALSMDAVTSDLDRKTKIALHEVARACRKSTRMARMVRDLGAFALLEK